MSLVNFENSDTLAQNKFNIKKFKKLTSTNVKINRIKIFSVKNYFSEIKKNNPNVLP